MESIDRLLDRHIAIASCERSAIREELAEQFGNGANEHESSGFVARRSTS
jgi:hypothetical protein